jgi:uncharacterized spore protein YtfJ
MDDQVVPTPSTEANDEMLKTLNVNAVFGKPVKEGDVTVIPVAFVRYGFGYGSGFGRGPMGSAEGGEEPKPTGVGGGSGAGGMGRSSPLGFIRIEPGGVRFEPIMNLTPISLAGIALSAWSVFWIALTIRSVVGKGRCCS